MQIWVTTAQFCIHVCSLITCSELHHAPKLAAFTDKQHFRAYVSPCWLRTAICVHSRRVNKVSHSPHVDRQCCDTVVLKTTPLCCYAPGVPQFFVNSRYLVGEKLQPHPAGGWWWPSVSIERPQNDDSEGQGVMISCQHLSLQGTMERLFLPTVFTLSLGCDRVGVSAQHMASSDRERW